MAPPFPKSLLDAVRAGRCVPFVGSGVSKAVLATATSKPLFPDWKELLAKAADRVEAEGDGPIANAIRSSLALNKPGYLYAADLAEQSLGPPIWTSFLREQFDRRRADSIDASLDLARAVWLLASNFIITTNYDSVLRWSCPDSSDLRQWSSDENAALVEMLKRGTGLELPAVWHLHGHIHVPEYLVLTPDDYSGLYPRGRDDAKRAAAIRTLQSLMASTTLVFIGFSFNDESFRGQFDFLAKLYGQQSGPHFLFVREADKEKAQELVQAQPTLRLVIFDDFGQPLIDRVRELAGQKPAPPAPSGPPGESAGAGQTPLPSSSPAATSAARGVSAFASSWEKRTTPPLSIDVQLLGAQREAAAAAIRHRMSQSKPGVIFVGADRVDDAATFLLAASRQAVPDILLLDDPSELESSLHHGFMPQLAIATSALSSSDLRAAAERHRILIGGLAPRTMLKPDVNLSPLAAAALKRYLSGLSLDDQEVQRLAKGSGGRISVLQRLLGDSVPPSWATQDIRLLLVALVVGEWAPSSAADRTVIEQLGESPDELDQTLQGLAQAADSPVQRVQQRGIEYWRWVSRADAWAMLARHLTPAMLRGFAKQAIGVLSEIDPQYNLPPLARLTATITGHRPTRSHGIRAGIVDTLIRLAEPPKPIGPTDPLTVGPSLVTNVILEVLKPEWKSWASLSNLLPTLAEAAPAAFANALDQSLALGDGGATHLLREEQPLGRTPHTGLLWALETLGWHRELWTHAATQLADLARNDPGGNLTNRPLRSLENLLHPLFPQSATTADERMTFLKRLQQLHSELAWKLLLSIFRNLTGPGVFTNSRRPAVASWQLPPLDRQSAPPDVSKQVAFTIDLALDAAGNFGQRWAALIDPLWRLDEVTALRFLSRLSLTASILQDAGEVRGKLRHLLHSAYQFGGSWRINSEVKSRVSDLYDRLTPPDIVDRFSWLFDNNRDLPEPVEGGFSEVHNRRLVLQEEAIAVIWDSGGKAAIFRLLKSVVQPWQVGLCLARAPMAAEMETALLEERDASAREALPSFIATRYLTMGSRWLQEQLVALCDNDRTEEAIAVAVACHSNMLTWEVVECMGELFRGQYWRSIGALYGDRPPKEWEYAVDVLLQVERPSLAVNVAAHARPPVDASLALRVLFAAAHASEEEVVALMRGTMTGYDIAALFKIAGEGGASSDELLKLQVPLAPLMMAAREEPALLFESLSSRPELFSELVEFGYPDERQQGEKSDSDADLNEYRIRYAWEILHAWHDVPGSSASSVERDGILESWITQAFDRLERSGRRIGSLVEIGKVLARASPGVDGYWPPVSVRMLLENNSRPDLLQHIVIAKRNMRGIYSKSIGEGGDQERRIAASYKAFADALRVEWPRTAAMLDSLERSYVHDAVREDAEAEADRKDFNDDDIAADPP